MNIDKAIELKELTGPAFLNADPDELDEADRLSVKAMKAIRTWRIDWIADPLHQLPGETIE